MLIATILASIPSQTSVSQTDYSTHNKCTLNHIPHISTATTSRSKTSPIPQPTMAGCQQCPQNRELSGTNPITTIHRLIKPFTRYPTAIILNLDTSSISLSLQSPHLNPPAPISQSKPPHLPVTHVTLPFRALPQIPHPGTILDTLSLPLLRLITCPCHHRCLLRLNYRLNQTTLAMIRILCS